MAHACMHNAATGVSVPKAFTFQGRPAAAAAVSAIANVYIPARLLLRMTAASLRLSGGVSQHQHQAHLQPRHADHRRQHAPASYVKNTPTSGGGKAVLGRVFRATCEYAGYEYDERGWIRSNTAGECPLEHWLERTNTSKYSASGSRFPNVLTSQPRCRASTPHFMPSSTSAAPVHSPARDETPFTPPRCPTSASACRDRAQRRGEPAGA